VRDVQVKWPNDLVVHFRKLAGILVETSGEIQGPSVAVIGVGVNYRLPESVLDGIDQPVIDVAQCAPALPSRSRLLGRIAASLAAAFEDFDARGFEGVRDEWRSLHAYQGRAVRISAANQPAFDAHRIARCWSQHSNHPLSRGTGSVHRLRPGRFGARP